MQTLTRLGDKNLCRGDTLEDKEQQEPSTEVSISQELGEV